MHNGSCLCGAVTFEFDGELAAPNGCHCSQCRKQTGHYLVSTDVERSKLKVSGKESLVWYQSSGKVRRGFCATCGSTLFWDPLFQQQTAIAMGAFDTPTHVQMGLHIFVSDKGDYYDLTDGLPQNQK
ncbi:aldehyde-activating protein [Rhodobacterales bacterium 56_14_T64]|nr:aldehyde-activating protein [Rhodobacterales bacterium 56_14_T64]